MTLQKPQLTHDLNTDSAPNPFKDPSPLNVPYRVIDNYFVKSITQERRRKIAIIGFGEGDLYRRSGPWDDPEWEIWSFNMGNRLRMNYDAAGRFRADRWFDLHQPHAQNAKDQAWIDSCPVPIYLPSLFTHNPKAVVYPLCAVEAWLSKMFHVEHPYWASSYAYAVALAMMEGATTIGLFGVDMNWGRERSHERANLEFFLGLAMGHGIEVISNSTVLLRHPARYGFEYDAERDAVIAECAELLRQFMQAQDMKDGFATLMDARIYALQHAKETFFNTVNNFTLLSFKQLREILDAEQAALPQVRERDSGPASSPPE